MKILNKSQTESLKTIERRKEIDEGIKLARKIDVLRDTSSKEEEKLRLFRTQSLQTITNEISVLSQEKVQLENDIKAKKAERLKLEAPIDLTEEWKKIEIENKHIANEKSDLRDREMSIINREALVHDFAKRESAIKSKEKDVTSYLNEAQKSYETADNVRSQIEEKKKLFDDECSKKQSALTEKENDLITREYTLNTKVENLQKEKQSLLNLGSELIKRESVVEAQTKSLVERDELVKETEAYTKRLNEEALKNYNLSESLKDEAQKIKDDVMQTLDNREAVLNEKQKELEYKERDLLNVKEQIEIEKKDIEREKLHIASQQETLRVAWLNIKRLQK